MNIEDLNKDDVVEAKCLKCGEFHRWVVNNLSLAPRVALHVTPYETCACKRQLVCAADIERKLSA